MNTPAPKFRPVLALLSGAVLWSASPATVAQTALETFDFGRREYVSNCSGCHGPSGRGDGAFKAFLSVSPPDLTRLSQRNQGQFPQQRIYRTIDGRNRRRCKSFKRHALNNQFAM